jgi:hypothetical protein
MKKKLIIVTFMIVFIFLITNFSVNIINGQLVKIKDDKNHISLENQYDLLIITPKNFLDCIEPLIQHKNNYEVKTKAVTVENIYEQIFWRGIDNSEKIKYFIKDAKENWNIKYVLLIGGRKDQSKSENYHVPVRYTNIIRDYKGHEDYPEGDFLTDLYFADIYDSDGNFSSWDDDRDGIFGEWYDKNTTEDKPDLYPDVAVGRLTCRNIFDVKLIVDKIIHYESGNFDDSWFKKMLVVAGDTYPEKTDYIDGENYTEQAIEIMKDFETVKIYSTLGNLNWFNIIRQINKGCGFLFLSGHGGANSWATHPPNDIDNWIGNLKNKHLIFLFNKNRLPVCLSASGCFNNMFNVSLSKSFLVYSKLFGIIPIESAVPRCFGSSLVLRNLGGSIATIASTAYSYESSDIDSKRGGCEWLDIHFFEEYQNSKTKILGDCWMSTINKFLQNFSINWNDSSTYGDAIIAKNVEQWLLIGDPSLKIGGYN